MKERLHTYQREPRRTLILRVPEWIRQNVIWQTNLEEPEIFNMMESREEISSTQETATETDAAEILLDILGQPSRKVRNFRGGEVTKAEGTTIQIMIYYWEY